MFLSLCIVLSLLHDCLMIDLTYRVQEEKPSGTYIADIAADSTFLDTIKSSEQSLITFSQLKEKLTQLFNVTKPGKLYTAQILDAESLCTYNKKCFRIVKVAVRKTKSFTKILKIKLIIEDINDHQPEFPQKQVNIKFSETDIQGTVKSLPNAIDRDLGFQNSLIEYKLKKKEDEPFSLSVFKRADGISSLRIILEKPLNREIQDSFTLNVIAKDGGTPPKQSVLNVVISVEDENDNQPVFSKPLYNISLKSTHEKTKPVVVISATDLDLGENGKISYYFSPKTPEISKKYFQLNKETGEIFMVYNSQLDGITLSELFVEARDGGSPPLSSIATVLVNVIDQHNNPPNIDVNFISSQNDNTATIPEDIKVGSFIAYVMVTDNDVGLNGQVSCDIKHDKFKLRSMGSKEYNLVLEKPVDRETQDHYKITLSCQDKGLPPLISTENLSIQVTDINDVQPKFTKDTFQFLTYENKDKDFPIGFVNATDLDLGPGGQLTYFLSNKDKPSLPFIITSYGFISTTMSLDREKQDVYKFQVFVKDNGLPSLNDTANVVVEILDQNDNAPFFTFPSVDPYNLDIHYYPQGKKDITVLRASDRDNGNNAFLTYGFFKGNDKNLFAIKPHSGVVYFSRKVYLDDAGAYELVFIVKDSGTPMQSATTTVSLTLTVSNKTSPMLTAVQLQSDNLIDVTLLIIIVAAAVIVFVVIVVSITLCIVRCVKHGTTTVRTGKKPPYNSEMRQLLIQTNNPIGLMNSENIISRNVLPKRTKHQLYPENLAQNKYKAPIITRNILKSAQKYSEPVVATSNDDAMEHNTDVPDYTLETLPAQRDGRHKLREGGGRHYEEIPSM
ncbi:protocadherin beta-15 isoform X1 [Octopus bimaculoides]|uniref:Cadherin domain-containing protein n=1 Tax=Octopus bimaculoides TaxID=37653 RepID=A0A0L8GG15_OCTBM|nr:protocadherin beta-15 isoform X1 [Octopus bimaculoides]|eukprot:XP_014781381.1 PREDICTED: protocadherin beta-15-like isoform X1 [Octopus bimaculoides]